ncbi:MAG TPA: Rieske (2Fe-2S) protein [Planosporangium sp.]|jgi:Rieske Fe-S protein|nr:Rieske (2Fe-2S) protein [Planosporangium sp.]
MSDTTRRTVLAGAAGAGAAVALAACGGSGGGYDGSKPGPTATGAQSTRPAPGASASGGPAPGAVLARTSDIPVGGGKVFDAEKVVVTQPTAGQFKAFTAICTHAGCTVGSVSDGTINCPCHRSKYSISDGSVKGGPAPRPLAAKQVTVKGSDITVTG